MVEKEGLRGSDDGTRTAVRGKGGEGRGVGRGCRSGGIRKCRGGHKENGRWEITFTTTTCQAARQSSFIAATQGRLKDVETSICVLCMQKK